jgi:hypothetical protein
MLYESMLRNLYKYEFISFLKDHEVKSWSSRMKTSMREDYRPIIQVIQSELRNTASSINEEIVDTFLFNTFFNNKSNLQFIYKLNNTFLNRHTLKTKNEIINYLNSFPELKYNESLINFQDNQDFTLCTTRTIFDDDNLKQIKILFKCEAVNTNRDEIDIFASFLIDLENNLLSIRFNPTLYEYYSDKLGLITKVKNFILTSTILEKLDIQFSSFNETISKKTIFNMFKELSEEAEALLNNRVPRDAEEKIQQFLQQMSTSIKTDYVKQIKAVIFQDVSETFTDTLFTQGWVFKFLFNEGQYTRAASNTRNFKPIYSSKVYWNLKEVIFKEKEMNEAGFTWFLPNTASSIIVKIESKNEHIILQYYDKKANYVIREEKEKFVLQKISTSLPTN